VDAVRARNEIEDIIVIDGSANIQLDEGQQAAINIKAMQLQV